MDLSNPAARIMLATLIRVGMERRGLDFNNFDDFAAYLDHVRFGKPLPPHAKNAEDAAAADAVEGRSMLGDVFGVATGSHFPGDENRADFRPGETFTPFEGPRGRCLQDKFCITKFVRSPYDDGPANTHVDDAAEDLLDNGVDAVILYRRPPGVKDGDRDIALEVHYRSDALTGPGLEDLQSAVDGAEAAILTVGYRLGDAARGINGASAAPADPIDADRSTLAKLTLLRQAQVILTTLQAMTDDPDVEEVLEDAEDAVAEWANELSVG